MTLARLNTKLQSFPARFSGIISICNNSTLGQENNAIEEHEEAQETKIRRKYLIRPYAKYDSLKRVNHFTSYNVSIEKISGISMTKDLEITCMQELPFTPRERMYTHVTSQVNTINKFIESFPNDATLCVNEGRSNFQVNSKYVNVLTHLQYVQAIITAHYSQQRSDAAFTLDSSLAGILLHLNINGRRKSGDKLVHRILQSGSWNGINITLPGNIKVVDDAVLVKNTKHNIEPDDENVDQQWRKISEPMNVALLQGLLFLDKVHGRKVDLELVKMP